jgi:uncharacterized protein (UPF0335 family)
MSKGIGHNSGDEDSLFSGIEREVNSGIVGIAADALQQYIDRIERLSEEKAALQEDIKQVYLEAKSTGFDTKTIRKIVQRRKLAEHERKEQDELQELYEDAIGMGR